MHFTRLRLLGFKSFVDPTELHIAPGLTGVVGPNGCGKSNLLEALRWVMGENRASAMRGDGMEDVIFAGSSARPARNHAEVTLVLDNRERLAPAGFNDADTLEVVRRITRDAGSAFRANGKETRARDVQILFADASTGAHSPSLVRQGQISELINAKPRARRRVLEEAAGISGLYQRRHEAELKLRATEVNLGRVADVLEALDGQLAALARQARQAAKYREIAGALRRAEALLLWRLWHDAETERAAAAAALLTATRAAGAAETQAAAAARVRAEAEDALPALREEDAIAGAVLQRLALERDRLTGQAEEAARLIADLREKLTQIAADRDREAALDRDAADSTARLAQERAELEAAGTGHADALSTARRTAEDSGAALRAAEQVFDAHAEAAARLAAEHQAASRALDEARRRDGEAERARARAEEALARSRGELAGAGTQHSAAATAAETNAAEAERAEAALAEAEATSSQCRAADGAARAALAEADGAVRALASEEAGLARLLAQDRGAGDRMLDAITVAPGFEAALGAALADDLSHPALPAENAASGWHDLGPVDAGALPADVDILSAHVAGPAALGRRLAAIGVVPSGDGARLQAVLGPGQRLVSREGDLWRWDGLHVARGAAPSAAAQRLQQQNRLKALAAQRAQAEDATDSARTAAARAAETLTAATEAERAARTARKAADQAASEAGRALTRAEAAREALQARVAALQAASARRAQERAAARQAFSESEAAAQGLADPAAARAAVEHERLKVEAARIRMMTHRGEADALERAGAARTRRLAEIANEAEGWTARQASAAARLGDLDRRAAETAAARTAAEAKPAEIEARLEELAGAHDEAETRRRRAADALAEAETRLRELGGAARDAERAAGEAREARARAEALGEAAAAAAAAALERLRSEAGQEPEALLAEHAAEAAAVPHAVPLESEVATLRRQRDALGAVNLRAEQDAREVEAERDMLAAEKDDLEAAIHKLRHGIANLNREGRERLLEAFDEVNRNFAMLFRHLFGGGEANLVLVESDDPLEAGLEIMCQPPGKKLSTLSLLSGGEQTLTALSLIFAVFLANPSPICVLDEVDAPLDDANVTRFCDLLDEMTRRTRTRFLIITHHAVTMARMDRLFGVTMAEQGVSQLVSVDLAGAERIVEVA